MQGGFSRASIPGCLNRLPPYYRIELEGYEPFAAPVPVSVLLQEYGEELRHDVLQNRPKHYPFAKYGDTVRLTQGLYLARCPPGLYDIFRRALGVQKAATDSPDETTDIHAEYTGSRRRSSEKYFFARNPQLVAAAKQHYGFQCQACGFDFATKYGEMGNGYMNRKSALDLDRG